MRIISDVYIISALKVFYWNKEEYFAKQESIDSSKADITKPILLLSNGKICEGWETLKYVLDSNCLTNVYYQLVEKELI
jgi:hypothetical protein